MTPKSGLTADEKELLLSLQEANSLNEVGSTSTAIEELVSTKNKDLFRMQQVSDCSIHVLLPLLIKILC